MSIIISNSNNSLLIISEIGLELDIDSLEEEYKKIFSEKLENKESILYNRSEERRVEKECRSRWSKVFYIIITIIEK